MVRAMFNTVEGKRICLLGFAFKKNTGDTRETAAAYVARGLLAEEAKVMVYDPKVRGNERAEGEVKGTTGGGDEVG
jgi:UDPglucose 6-dehydrogenase